MSYTVVAAVGIVIAAIATFYLQEHSWQISLLKNDVTTLRERVNEISLSSSSQQKRSNDLHSIQSSVKDDRRIALIAAKNIKGNDPAHLLHVQKVFDRLGYRTILGFENYQKSETEFDIFWNHEYPFRDPQSKPLVQNPKEHQKINHIPGSGYYTSKVSLATANLSVGVPLAFALPKQKTEFEAYAKGNPQTRWVQKSNAHRNIKVLPIDQLDTSKADTFIQKFVENPLLIDGKKFDIGIYTVITSISPLRVYIFDGDALIRFCPKNYEPFDAEDVDRYVVGDDYTPVWEMPSLKKLFVNNDLTFKETLNAYLKMRGKDPEEIWSQIREIIRRVFESQNSKMVAAAKGYEGHKNYFELSRFDFVVDSNLKVFLMEANMSPNLSSGHFKQNRLLYEQVIFNVLSLIGAAVPTPTSSTNSKFHSKNFIETKEMQVSFKDLNLHFHECDDIDAIPPPTSFDSGSTVSSSSSLTPTKEDEERKTDDCISCSKNASLVCKFCKKCMTDEMYEIFEQTFLEHLNRRQMRRILPRNFGEKGEAELTETDLVLAKWLEIKCKQNRHFCE